LTGTYEQTTHQNRENHLDTTIIHFKRASQLHGSHTSEKKGILRQLNKASNIGFQTGVVNGDVVHYVD